MKKFILFTLIIIMYMLSMAKQDNSIYNFEKEVKTILKKSSPSIVKVIAENHRKYIATGIVINNSQILSNIMVTRYHYDKLYIETNKGKKFPVKLIGKDKRTGLILLEYKTNELRPIKKSKMANAGDWIVIIGAFYNKIPSIYTGIVSNSSKEELILNAPLPPGGIGSAVLNRNGNLIGVVRGRLKFSSAPGYSFNKKDVSSLCYALPLQRVDKIIKQLKKFGKVKWGWLGVNIDTYKNNKGVLLTSIVNGSPASISNLKRGDIVIKINKTDMNSSIDLQRKIRKLLPGSNADFTIIRNGNKKQYLVKIGEKKAYNLKRTYNFKIPEGMKSIKILDEISRFPKIDIEKLSIELNRSLENISLHIPDKNYLKNKINIKVLKKKIIILNNKIKKLSSKDGQKLKKEILNLKKEIKTIQKIQYKKMKEEQVKILKKMKVLEKELNK